MQHNPADAPLFTCNRCSCTIHPIDQIIEWQERFIVSFRAGYGSLFGDGNYIEGRFCQECINDVLGQWLKVTSDDPFDSRHRSAIDAEKILQQYQFQKVISHKQLLAEIADIVRVGKDISPTRELLAKRLGIPESQIALVAYEYLLRATEPDIQSV